MHGTVQVGIVAELGHFDLRLGNAGKTALVASERGRHLGAKCINEFGMARNATRNHKDLGVEHGLQVYELGIKRTRIAVESALGRLVAGLDPLEDAAPVHGSKTAEATAALASLGYSQAEIGAALKGVKTDGMPTEEIVRQCLRAMVMR